MNCGQLHHISRPYVEYKLPCPPAALISPPCPSSNTPGCGAYASPANANFTLSVSLFLVHECLSPLPRLHHPPPSSPANLPPGLQYISPSEREEGGGGRNVGGGKPFLPSLTFDTAAECVQRRPSMAIYSARDGLCAAEGEYVCVTGREGEEESARENE